MLKKTLLFLAILVGLALFFAFSKLDNKDDKEIFWQSAKELQEALTKEKRPILVDLYTDWCYWCKVMDTSVYRNDSVISYLKKNYYRLKFNAESKSPLLWQGKTYNFNSQMKVHDFATAITGGVQAYPTTVIITPEGTNFQITGALSVNDMQAISMYFKSSGYKEENFEAFRSKIKTSWK